MATCNDSIHQNHPLLACFSGNYPEQVLMMCTKTGECLTCKTPQDKLGKFVEGQNLGHWDFKQILEALDSSDDDPGGFLQVCSEVGIKPIVEPF